VAVLGVPEKPAVDSFFRAHLSTDRDRVHFSVTAPGTVVPGTVFILDVWAHTDAQSDDVLRRAREIHPSPALRVASKGPVGLPRDSSLNVRLDIPTFGVRNEEDALYWDGEVGNAAFLVTVAADVPTGEAPGTVSIFVGILQVCRLAFILQLGNATAEVGRLYARERRVRSGFASYASNDRNEVLARIQGMQKIAPKLDVFLDVASLRSGERWEERLRVEIETRDIFYLFWSLAASRSEWVSREWRTALACRGLQFIDPVPLQSPTTVPPPPELASLHFGDWTLAFRRSPVDTD
jgi:hypothetical protein